MNEQELIYRIEDTAKMLYQNKEQEGLKDTEELIKILQFMISNLTEEQLQEAGEFSIIMIKELLEAYQSCDMLAIADCLLEKARLFVTFYYSKK